MADLGPLLNTAHRRNMRDPIFHAKFRMVCLTLEVDERLVGDLALGILLLAEEAAEMVAKGVDYTPPEWLPGQQRARDQLQTLAHVQKVSPEAWKEYFPHG